MTIDWPAVGKAALFIGLPLAGFLLGGGWPWKAYRRLGDLDLVERLKDHYVSMPMFDAHVREEELRHQRRDDIIDMLTKTVRTMESFAGTLAAQGEGIKYLAAELSELKDEVRADRKSG